MEIYRNDWAKNEWREEFGEQVMLNDFQITKEAIEGAEILLAAYTYEDYSGDAYVLFRKNGKLFEVSGGHCSCYGLEGQWEPEEVTPEALRHRLEEGKYFNSLGLKDDLLAILDEAA